MAREHPGDSFAMHHRGLVVILALLFSVPPLSAKERVLDAALHHLRFGNVREWSDFPEKAEGPSLTLRFQAEANRTEWALRLRQQDVKQTWKVLLNGTERGRLVPDENDQVIYIPLPPGALVAGENTLRIEQVGQTPDDIRVGEISLDDRPSDKVLAEATVEITVSDAAHND